MWLNLAHLIFFRDSKFVPRVFAILKLADVRRTFGEICSEMHANEIHELYDRHHKVFPNLNSK